MFLPQRVGGAGKFAVGKENELESSFDSAARIGKEREKKYGATFKISESSRMFVGKAQYQWGWDWGILATRNVQDISAGLFKVLP